jgi:PHD/YefM family antitoxin component YafN of YafNO toxin-antitoxin module
MLTSNIVILLTLHPQFIKDANGKKSMVVLSAKEYEEIMEELDMIEDVRLYDEAKKEDDGTRISLADYVKSRKKKSA